jgi:PIN domain nuclease of toxin-antitoxin system
VTVVLVDTHIALWALGEPGRLTDLERSLLVDPTIDRCLSPISIWEEAIKREAGRLRAPRGLTVVVASQFPMLAITAALVEQAVELPKHHLDPFDRVLIAHALSDDIENTDAGRRIRVLRSALGDAGLRLTREPSRRCRPRLRRRLPGPSWERKQVGLEKTRPRGFAPQPRFAVVPEEQPAILERRVSIEERGERKVRAALRQMGDDPSPRHGQRFVVLAGGAGILREPANPPRARDGRLDPALARVDERKPDVIAVCKRAERSPLEAIEEFHVGQRSS